VAVLVLRRKWLFILQNSKLRLGIFIISYHQIIHSTVSKLSLTSSFSLVKPCVTPGRGKRAEAEVEEVEVEGGKGVEVERVEGSGPTLLRNSVTILAISVKPKQQKGKATSSNGSA
jgi:hypothetical protein